MNNFMEMIKALRSEIKEYVEETTLSKSDSDRDYHAKMAIYAELYDTDVELADIEESGTPDDDGLRSALEARLKEIEDKIHALTE